MKVLSKVSLRNGEGAGPMEIGGLWERGSATVQQSSLHARAKHADVCPQSRRVRVGSVDRHKQEVKGRQCGQTHLQLSTPNPKHNDVCPQSRWVRAGSEDRPATIHERLRDNVV